MQKRHELWWLVVFLLVCNTMIMQNMNIAIVSMISNNETLNANDIDVLCPNTTFFLRKYAGNDTRRLLKPLRAGYNWSTAEQNMVLSGFYWMHYISIIPGGVLALRYGSRTVVGYAILAASILSSAIPVAARYGPVVVSWIRTVQGILSFMAVPAGMYSILASWSPPQERGKFGATFTIGWSIGMALGSFLFGYIAQYFRWEYVFHITSAGGLVWSIFWFANSYDTPAEHPYITDKEKAYIESSLKGSSSEIKSSIPWWSFITSVPVIVCVLAINAALWAWVMLMTYSPIYLKNIYGLNTNEIGIIMGVPSFAIFVLSFGIAYFSDLSIKKEWLSISNTRKLCTFIGGVVALAPLIVVAYTKCDLTLVIVCFLIINIIKPFIIFGPSLVIMDMSPKFCGILEGIGSTVSCVQTFVIAATINYLSTIWEVEKLWKNVFLFTTSYSFIATILFVVLGTSETQNWNFENRSKRKVLQGAPVDVTVSLL